MQEKSHIVGSYAQPVDACKIMYTNTLGVELKLQVLLNKLTQDTNGWSMVYLLMFEIVFKCVQFAAKG